MESLIETCSLKGEESDKNLPSCVAPELVKVLEKVAVAHWMECQPEVQNLLVAPMDNEEEMPVHQTRNNRRIRYQATVSHVIQQKPQHFFL